MPQRPSPHRGQKRPSPPLEAERQMWEGQPGEFPTPLPQEEGEHEGKGRERKETAGG